MQKGTRKKTKDEEGRGRSRVGLVGLGSATGTRRRGYDISRTDDSTRHENQHSREAFRLPVVGRIRGGVRILEVCVCVGKAVSRAKAKGQIK